MDREPTYDLARRQRLFEKYADESITREELAEFLRLLDEDVEYARWKGSDDEVDALTLLSMAVRSALLLRGAPLHPTRGVGAAVGSKR